MTMSQVARRLGVVVLAVLACANFADSGTALATASDEDLSVGCPSPPDPEYPGIRVWVHVVKWCSNGAVRGQAQVKLQIRVKNIGSRPLDLSRGHFRLVMRHFDRRRWSPPQIGASTTDRPFVATYGGRRVWTIPPNADGAYDLIGNGVGTFASHWNTAGTLAPGHTFAPIDRTRQDSGRGSVVFYVPLERGHRNKLPGVIGLAYVQGNHILVMCPRRHWGPKVPEGDF